MSLSYACVLIDVHILVTEEKFALSFVTTGLPEDSTQECFAYVLGMGEMLYVMQHTRKNLKSEN